MTNIHRAKPALLAGSWAEIAAWHPYPIAVTGVLRVDGTRVDDLRVDDHAEVRAFLLAGPRLTDGVVVPSGWADLICATCGEGAEHCATMRDALV